MLAGAQHTTDQRQTDACGYQRQGINVEEFQSITTKNIKNILQEIKVKNVEKREQELRIEALYALHNTSKCPEEKKAWKTIIEEERIQQQELCNISSQLQLLSRPIRQQLPRDEQLIQQNLNQSRQIEVVIKQNEKQQEQQQNQSLQIEVLMKQNEKQLKQQQHQQEQQQNQSRLIEVLMNLNEKQQEQQRQQRELLNNISSQHQLIFQQLGLLVQQKEQEARYENRTLELNATLTNQEQGMNIY